MEGYRQGVRCQAPAASTPRPYLGSARSVLGEARSVGVRVAEGRSPSAVDPILRVMLPSMAVRIGGEPHPGDYPGWGLSRRDVSTGLLKPEAQRSEVVPDSNERLIAVLGYEAPDGTRGTTEPATPAGYLAREVAAGLTNRNVHEEETALAR
jgi:hypothetical protein